MVRSIAGVLVGIVVAFATIMLVERLGAILYPQPAPVDWTEQVAVADWVARIPLPAKLLVAFGWFVGALVGALVAARLSRRRAMGWLPAALVLVGGIANIAMIPHALWMTLAALVMPIAGGWVGARSAASR